MSQALCFNKIQFSPVNRDNQLWIRASELARALGYAREDKVAQIYQRNADEFTPDMTQTIENVAEPQFEGMDNLNVGRTRIFSPRGCHLIAMFARTPIAKEFRKWVLDVLEAELMKQVTHRGRKALPKASPENRTSSREAELIAEIAYLKGTLGLIEKVARTCETKSQVMWSMIITYSQDTKPGESEWMKLLQA